MRAPLVLLLRDASGYGTATLFGARLPHARPAARPAADPARRGARYRTRSRCRSRTGSWSSPTTTSRSTPARLVPVYSTTEGLPQRALRSLHVATRRGVRGATCPRRCRRRCGVGATIPTLPEALRERALPGERGRRAQRGPPPPRLRGLPPAAARPGDPALAHDARAGHRDEPARRAGEPAARGAAVGAHRCAGARVGRDPSRHGRAASDAPAAAGRRRLGQDDRGGAGRADRDRGRLPGRRDGADRDPGRAALHDASGGCWSRWACR